MIPSLESAASSAREFVASLKTRIQEQDQSLRTAYEKRKNASALLKGRAVLIDAVLQELWYGHALPPALALIAVGGYGRGELYPYSDIDLLVLLPQETSDATNSRVEQLIGLAWDLGLDIGHSVRTVVECIAAAACDITVQTSLFESRLLAGDRELYREFERQLREQLNPRAFFKAKRLEQEERYLRYNETPFSLEPNCKESPGGLRDLQTIRWISAAAGVGNTWSDLARSGLITGGEARQLKQVEEFLQHVRIRLHLLAGRREDRLVFDHQEALAALCGFPSTSARRASEVLMQRYYRNAQVVTQLNTMLLQNLGDVVTPSETRVPIVLNEHFQADRELLDVRREDLFEVYPSTILQSFLLLQQRSELKGMTARTLRALWRARRMITPGFRRNPGNRAAFLWMFQQKRGLVRELRRMNQYGILGRYLPAFGRIVGQMQHDLFHVYTVDLHILQVMRNVLRFTLAEHAHEYPLCTRLITGFERYWLICIAALFHDIAKGRGGDHSKLGSREAKRFCLEHGLPAEDTELIVFLVEHHLTMSSVAQKQDLSHPDVIRSFADVVRTERRLIALYLLTHADIRGTSPKVWNAWKGKLLEDLYFATQRLMRGTTFPHALGIAERQEDTRRMLRYYGLRSGIETELWQELDTVYFMRHDADEITWHTRMLYYRPRSDEPVVKARINPIGEGLQVMAYTRDQRDLFARLCGFFGKLGYSIVDAKIHTTRHGYALDSFVLLDPANNFNTRDMISLIEHDLVERLRSSGPPDKPVTGRLSRQVKHFPITPEVSIRPDDKGSHYIMSVTAADRPGLLFAIAQILARHKIHLHTAKIATLGERAEDTFLISGNELSQTHTLLRVEQELLEQLQV